MEVVIQKMVVLAVQEEELVKKYLLPMVVLVHLVKDMQVETKMVIMAVVAVVELVL